MNTEPTWATRPSELAPDYEPRDACAALRCKRHRCSGDCPESLALRALAARLEAERLERLAMRRSA